MMKAFTSITFFALFMLGISNADVLAENTEAAAVQAGYSQCVWDNCNVSCDKGNNIACMAKCEKKVRQKCMQQAKDEANP